MAVILWTAIAFLSGSLPFAVWVGRLFVRADVRQYGDGNPGAANAWRAGGWHVGLLAGLLDWLKGALPVGLAHFWGHIAGVSLVPVALAPVLGHAFSPFLGFRGGKAVAVTFGIWTGLLPGGGPIALGLLLTLFYLLQTGDSWAVMLTLIVFLGYLLARGVETELLAIWALNTALLAWTHRKSFQRPRLRAWIRKALRLGQ